MLDRERLTNGRFRFVGVDVGGYSKGFHCVGLADDDTVVSCRASVPEQVVAVVDRWGGEYIAIDAPMCWAGDGNSRECERALEKAGLHCFKTPSEKQAGDRPFYAWIRNGLGLYSALRQAQYIPIFNYEKSKRIIMETFPHAVATRLGGHRPVGVSKVVFRREVLRKRRIDDSKLKNIDFVDAALCALVARSYGINKMEFLEIPGRVDEGMRIPCSGKTLK